MRRTNAACFSLILLCSNLSVIAAVRFLTIGGGPNPLLNQVSLERNVEYFQKVVAQLGLGEAQHQLLFADAGAGDRTVQYLAPSDDDFRFIANLELLGSDNSSPHLASNYRYRKTGLTSISDAATAASLKNWFTTTGNTIPAGDQLLLYYTGHGGADRGVTQPPRNTTMELWNQPNMTMRQFASLLDKTNPLVDVMLVMVQCHSGGFANVIYNGGEPSKGLSRQIRFGFFSTTADRLAAGCTPDIQGDDYREFSTAFFAALSGRTRGGQPIEKPDFGHKGYTTYMDAFTYVLLTSDTIDIPMTTSDLLLRDFSKYGQSASKETSRSSILPTTTKAAAVADRLIPADAPFKQVFDAASDADKAAITGLAKVLKLDPNNPISGARDLASRYDNDHLRLMVRMNEALKSYTAARAKFRAVVYRQWPELNDPWLKQSEDDLNSIHLPALKKAIESLPEYSQFVDAFRKYDDLSEKGELQEKTWVKAVRLLQRADTVILSENLHLVASPEVQQRYQILLKHENGTLSPTHL